MNTCINIEVKRIGDPISVSAERHGEGLSFSAKRIGEPLKFRCGLVCTIPQTRYLKVEPQTVWLLPENAFSADVVVYSNVTWRIE